MTDLAAAIAQAQADFDRLERAHHDCVLDGRRWPSSKYRQRLTALKRLARLKAMRVDVIASPLLT